MHMSDGLVNAPTAAVFGLVAVLGLAIAASRARADLDERTGADGRARHRFVFAVQMINFPILPGASGHLLGGALVAILVGPLGRVAVHRDRAGRAGAPVRRRRPHRAGHQHHEHGARGRRSPVTGVAYALRRVAARSRRGLVATAFVAALVNTVVAALAFVVEYAVGGSGGAALAPCSG
jgi:cobalt/nickel transport system permease protein